MTSFHNDKHFCILPKRKKHYTKPLHPAAGILAKLYVKYKSLVILDLNSTQAKEHYTHASVMRAELRRHANGPQSYIIHPFSKLNAFIERFFFLLLLHRTVFVVYAKLKSPNLFLSCLVRDAFHVFIMACFFFTGYADKKTREVCTDHCSVIKHYLTTYFVIDLYLAIEEYIQILRFEIVTLFVMCISLLSYIIRFRSISYLINDTLVALKINKTFCFILSQTALLAFVLHIFTSLAYWVPTHWYNHFQNHPNDSWISQKGISFKKYDVFTYIDSYSLVVAYFMGTSCYDVVTQPIEQLIFVIYTFTGRLYILVIIAKVLIFFGYSDVSESAYENLYYQLTNYIRAMKVPPQIKKTLFERLNYTYQKKYFNEQEILSTFTEHIKSELFLFGGRNLISKNLLLKNLDKYELSKLFINMKSHLFSPEEIILDFDDIQPYVFFVSTGSVAGFTLEGMQFIHLGDGDVFGCIRLHPSAQRLYNPLYLSLETTEVYYIHYKELRWALHDNHSVYNYFESIRRERLSKYTRCTIFKGKMETTLDQLKKGELLEKRRLKHGPPMV
ncbi:unnamed protein product [Diabrotica balteata]|uniref:Uncharacterized protein n=1 Tax=Diabrotica balteata TaxID=107213 RepID=A0A9N9SVT4_DIABA|nr:unnamed protein product [Diabrotica balteata]